MHKFNVTFSFGQLNGFCFSFCSANVFGCAFFSSSYRSFRFAGFIAFFFASSSLSSSQKVAKLCWTHTHTHKKNVHVKQRWAVKRRNKNIVYFDRLCVLFRVHFIIIQHDTVTIVTEIVVWTGHEHWLLLCYSCRDVDPIPNKPSSSQCRRFVPRPGLNGCARDRLSQIVVSVVKPRTKYISSTKLLAAALGWYTTYRTTPTRRPITSPIGTLAKMEFLSVHLFSHHRSLVRLRSVSLCPP